MRARRSLGVLVKLLTLATIEIAVGAQAQTFDLLYQFQGIPDGYGPVGLFRDNSGDLYGVTNWGGTSKNCGPGAGCGTVYKIDNNGHYTQIYNFQGQQDGAQPLSTLIADSAGNLYGTSLGNGYSNSASTIFRIDKNGQETVLHRFHDFTSAPVVRDAAGNLYGTTDLDGTACREVVGGCGTVYKLDTRGTFTTLHKFTGANGAVPMGGLVLGDRGDLYGVTIGGGGFNCSHDNVFIPSPSGCGVVFKVDKNGKETVLHRFTGKEDGWLPMILIRDPRGNVYGIAYYGGDLNCYARGAGYGCGTIFKVDTNGKFRVLYTYTGTSHFPGWTQVLLRDARGNLYGTKAFDGANNAGFLFRLDPGGKFTDMFDFPDTGSSEGDGPDGLARDASGTFYGVMSGGGIVNCGINNQFPCGTVYKLSFR